MTGNYTRHVPELGLEEARAGRIKPEITESPANFYPSPYPEEPDMPDTLSPARERLRQAQLAHAEAANKAARLHAQRQKLHDVALGKATIESELAAAREQHTEALSAWALAGAEGDAPEVPNAIERLERKLVAAQREVDAARAAAEALNPAIESAQQAAQATLGDLRQRREDVLREIAAPLIEDAHRTALHLNSLHEHLAAIGVIAPEIRDEFPRAGNLSFEVAEALRVFPVLEPGGADTSRHAWRTLIADLAGDPSAQLAPPPQSVDNDRHIRKPFLPPHLRGE